MDLSSTDWQEIWGGANRIFYDELTRLGNEGAVEAVEKYRNIRAAANAQDRNATRITLLNDLTQDELLEYARYEGARGMLWNSSHIIAERNRHNAAAGSPVFDRQNRREKMIAEMQAIKNMGHDAKYVHDLYSRKKFWPTYTPHPTKDKSDEGRESFKASTRIAEEAQPQDRPTALHAVVEKMLRTRNAPDRKDTLEDETADSMSARKIYIEGMLDYIEDLQFAADTVFGSGAIDFGAEEMLMDLAPRDWYAGDADGKAVPAPVLFNKRVKGALAGVKANLAILDNDALKGSADHARLGPVIDVFRQIEAKLEVLRDKGDDLVAAGSYSPEFEQAKADFKSAFRSAVFRPNFPEDRGARTFTRGPELTDTIFRTLQEIRENGDVDESVRMAAQRSIFRHRQIGIAMGRQENRHNSEDFTKIFDNLFTYLRDNGLASELYNPKTEVRLSKLKTARQIEILRELFEQYDAKQVGQWLDAANPRDAENPGDLDIEANWLNEIIQRFDVIRCCFNHRRMGATIIAEAQEMSLIHQLCLAKSKGIDGMTHMALNEEEKTIAAAPENLKMFVEAMGLTDVVICVMVPMSDSQKQNGIEIKPVQDEASQGLMDLGLVFGRPPFEKKGSGAAYARGGFSPLSVTRMFLTNLLKKTGGVLYKGAKAREVLKDMASYTSTTVQGHHVEMALGTPAQVYDLLDDFASETNAACLVIDGKIAAENIVPLPPEQSPDMGNALKRAGARARDIYRRMRMQNSTSDPGKNIYDLYMQATSATAMAEFTGTGARKKARNGKKSFPGEAKTTGLRAIGCNINNEFGLHLADGSYTSGGVLMDLHREYQENNISKQDLIALTKDEGRMRQMWGNAMASQAMADYENAFDRLQQSDKRWTVGAVLEAAKTGFEDYDELTAQHLRLTYDAILYTSLVEGLLNSTNLDGPDDRASFDRKIEDMVMAVYNPGDTLHELKFGPATHAAYPDIKPLQDHARDVRFMRAVIYEVEDRVRLFKTDPANPKAIDPEVQSAALFQIACAMRQCVEPSIQSLMDQPGSSPGARKEPVRDILVRLGSNVQTELELANAVDGDHQPRKGA